MNGIICILKPPLMTSHDAVSAVRRLTGVKRVGHTGTLDPNATGVLPICIGRATRLIEYMDFCPKAYRCEAILGLVTDTQDIWGNVISDERRKASAIDRCQVEDALSSFKGHIMQTPPAYSAVKLQGKRLYEYARSGVDVQVPERRVTISDIELLSFDEASGRFSFDVTCSRGTYVRAICHDLGRLLGVGAAMSFLLRTESHGFTLEDCSTFEELSAMSRDELEKSLLPLETAVRGLPRLDVDDEAAELFLNGNMSFQAKLKAPEPLEDGTKQTYAVFCGQRLLGTADALSIGIYKPAKVLSDENI